MNDLNYPVVDHVEALNGDVVPLLDIPMMSDEKWATCAKEQQKKHPKEYAELLKQMREQPEIYTGMITPIAVDQPGRGPEPGPPLPAQQMKG